MLPPMFILLVQWYYRNSRAYRHCNFSHQWLPCLSHLHKHAMILLRPWRYISHVLTYLNLSFLTCALKSPITIVGWSFAENVGQLFVEVILISHPRSTWVMVILVNRVLRRAAIILSLTASSWTVLWLPLRSAIIQYRHHASILQNTGSLCFRLWIFLNPSIRISLTDSHH